MPERLFCTSCAQASRDRLAASVSKGKQESSGSAEPGEVSEPSSEEENWRESAIEKSARTQSTQQQSENETERATTGTGKSTESETDSGGRLAPRPHAYPMRNDGLSIEERIEKVRMQGSEDIIEKTKTDSGNSSTPVVLDGIPTKLSDQPFKRLEEESSNTMSLIDESATHLVGYMRDLGKDIKANPTLRDFRTINAIANLGKQVGSLAKVKIEAIKIMKEIRSESISGDRKSGS